MLDLNPTKAVIAQRDSDIAIGGKLLARVRLERLWAIKERAAEAHTALLQERTAEAMYQLRMIQAAVDNAVKEASQR